LASENGRFELNWRELSRLIPEGDPMARAAAARQAGKPAASKPGSGKPSGKPGVDIASLDVSLADVAALISCSKVRISQLVHEGVLPKPTNGRYPLLATVQAYVAHLKALRANAPSAEKKALVAAQVDLTKARTEEHKRKALGKEYILVSEARAHALKAYLSEIANFREQALGFHHAAAERCAGLQQGPMALVLQEEMHRLLNLFADGLANPSHAFFNDPDTNPIF
jgi:hypothetical protein